jgi:hypothetical protein
MNYFVDFKLDSKGLELASYTLVLKVIQTLNEDPFPRKWYEYPIGEYVHMAIEHLKGLSDLPSEVMRCIALVQSFQDKLSSSRFDVIRKPLYNLPNVDVERLQKDPLYLKSKILELSATMNDRELEMAIAIGAQDSISSSEILGHHFIWLFSNGFDVSIMRNRFQTYSDRIFHEFSTFASILMTSYDEMLSNNDMITFLYEIMVMANDHTEFLTRADKDQIFHRLSCIKDWKHAEVYSLLSFRLAWLCRSRINFQDVYRLISHNVTFDTSLHVIRSLLDLQPLKCIPAEEAYEAPKVNFQEVVHDVLLAHLENSDFDAMDDSERQRFLDGLCPALLLLDTPRLETVLEQLLINDYATYFDIEVRLNALKQCISQKELISDRLQRIKAHLELLLAVGALQDPVTKQRVPLAIKNLMESSFGNKASLKKCTLIAISKQVSPWLVHEMLQAMQFVGYSVDKLGDLYHDTILSHLSTANIDGIEQIIKSVRSYTGKGENRTVEELNDGWEVEDVFEAPSTFDQVLEPIEAVLFNDLRDFAYHKTADAKVKLQVLTLLESYYMDSNDQELKSRKQNNLIGSVWGVDVVEYSVEGDKEALFRILMERSTSPDHYLNLLGLIMEWEDSGPYIAEWIRKVMKSQFRDILLPLHSLLFINLPIDRSVI